MLGQQLDTIVYHVRAGDNLSKIINRYYGPITAQKRQSIIQQIQRDNPKVKNPHHIVPNQLLFIDVPQQYCAAPTEQQSTPILNISKHELKPFQAEWNRASSKQQDMLSSVAPVMLNSGIAGLDGLKASFRSNAPSLQKLVNLYDEYKAGNLTKGQYDYGRAKVIKQFESRMGPLSKLLNRRKSQRQILRISRRKGLKPAANISRQIQKMGKLSKLAAGGSILLAGLDLKLSCDAIGQADTRLEKNKIFAETLGGLFVGGAYGIAVAVIFAATPVGWVAALVLAAGGVAYGSLGHRAGQYVYDTKYRKVDLLSKTGVSHLCG